MRPEDIDDFVRSWDGQRKTEQRRQRRRAMRPRLPDPQRWDMVNMLIAFYATAAFIATAGFGAGVTLLIQWLRGRR